MTLSTTNATATRSWTVSKPLRTIVLKCGHSKEIRNLGRRKYFWCHTCQSKVLRNTSVAPERGSNNEKRGKEVEEN